MNFLRTQLIQRQSDLMKVRLDGQVWESQSILNVQAGRNIVFAQTETHNVSTLTVSAGTAGVFGYWGSFWDTTDQTVTSTTAAYVVTLNTADASNDGVSLVSNSQLTVANAAVYRVSVSYQFVNTDSQAHDVTFWFRKNGVDVPDSASRVTVPSTHGGALGHQVTMVEIVQMLAANDYVQLAWKADNTAVKIETLPAGTTPVHPQIPSVIVTVNQI
jgi:plastocyanin